MGHSTVTVYGRRRAPSRAVIRRRRWALVVVLVAAGVVIALVTTPYARKAVNDFGLPLRYQGIIRQQAADKHLDPALVAAVIYAETKFDPRPSSAGAEGLMQILPQTARFLAHRSGAATFSVEDLATPRVNISYGSYYLRYLLDEYGSNTALALAAYNGGEANVNHWLAAARARHRHFTVADIPFPETHAYVLKVLQAQQEYRRTYGSQLGYD